MAAGGGRARGTSEFPRKHFVGNSVNRGHRAAQLRYAHCAFERILGQPCFIPLAWRDEREMGCSITLRVAEWKKLLAYWRKL